MSSNTTTATHSGGFDFEATWEITATQARIHALDTQCVDLESQGSVLDATTTRRQRQRLIGLFDRTLAAKMFRYAENIGRPCRYSVTAHPDTVAASPEYVALLERQSALLHAGGSSVIVHLSGEPTTSLDGSLLRSVHKLRAAGVAIGLADVGTADSTYKLIVDVKPDYVRIADYFVKGCDRDLTRRIILRSISRLAERFSARPIATGIRTADELRAVADNGIELMSAPTLFGRMPADLYERLPLLPSEQYDHLPS